MIVTHGVVSPGWWVAVIMLPLANSGNASLVPECRYYSEDWSVSHEVIPPGQHVVGKAGTQLLESDNSDTRNRIARFTRRTKVVSRSEKMIDLTMRLWAYFEQEHNFAEYQKLFLCILR